LLGKNQILDSGFWSTGFALQDVALFQVDGTAVEIRVLLNDALAQAELLFS